MKIYEATEQAYKNGYKNGYEEGFKDGYDGGVEVGKRPALKWIPVSERFPEKCGAYICFFRSPYGNDSWRVGQCYWNEESWVRIGVVPPHVIVTNWMPLPEEPKEEE